MAKWVVNLNPLHKFFLRRGPKHVVRNQMLDSGMGSVTVKKSALLSESRVTVPPAKTCTKPGMTSGSLGSHTITLEAGGQ
jgi:hypothetical protein